MSTPEPRDPPSVGNASDIDWNRILPDEGESVFNRWIYLRHHDVHDALDAGALLAPPGQSSGHALIYAVWSRDFGLLRDLLKRGFEVNQLGFTGEGEHPVTALDAVAEDYHCSDGKIDKIVLDAMHALLREHGGLYACELSGRNPKTKE
ncbi:hypothetical protein [Haloferula sp. A504]|uniref:hypothetical protein n=1 Tax=Haloferula sp. A504 TaxID=3373601 RepID=UPI0031C2A3F4|nr:hypothetical protein [Verrucomicrobiaceae bacterium E54]